MMQLSKREHTFLELLRAGLWEQIIDNRDKLKEIDLSLVFPTEQWEEIYQLASEQSVVGLFLAGIEITDLKPQQELLLQWIGEIQLLEQRNLAMDELVAKLVERLNAKDVFVILVKGQGIAQCYEKPLWRSCGDVDFLLNDNNYQKTNILLSKIASSVEEENTYNQHIAMTIDGWSVELHGTLRSGLWKGIDRVLDKVQESVFYEGKLRTWMNGNTQVLLPAPDEDVVFVFSHILQHFFQEGIGLRQICDWCRLLWTYRDKINVDLLEKRLKEMGLISEWKAFATLAVEYLGMPEESMPLYSPEKRWSKKSSRILAFMLETGNFGHNRDYSYQKKYPYVLMKAISLWKHIVDFGRYFLIFPVDSIRVTCRRINSGFAFVAKGK